jgi:hypothetical protein
MPPLKSKREKAREASFSRMESGTWMKNHKPWTDAEDQVIGTDMDGKVAALIGRTRGAVVGRRHFLGIPPFRKPGRAVGEGGPWAEHKKGKRKPKL